LPWSKPLWQLASIAVFALAWRDLPERYGPWKTVYNRFWRWSRNGTLTMLVSRIRVIAEAIDELDHAAMRAAGVTFVCRYIGSQVRRATRDAKWLSPSEARALHSDDFDLAVVFETAARRADAGRPAGLADARTAVAELAYCGLLDDLPVYFAVDWDATVGPLITAYFTAVAEVLGLKRVGGVRRLQGHQGAVRQEADHLRLADIRLVRRPVGPAHPLEQYLNDERTGGASVDFDRSMQADFGQWRAATPVPSPEEDEMIARDVKTGLGEKSGFPFPAGKFSSLLFFADNTYTNGGEVKATAPVTVRYALLRTDGTWQVGTQVVGRAATAEAAVEPIAFKDPKNTVAVSVTRVDGDGTEPITFAVA
jgi:transposase